jgi:rare lipoprotein A
MHSSGFILAMMLAATFAVMSGAAPAVAQSEDAVAVAPVKKLPTRGFDWFFANTPKPEGPCMGEHVVATWYQSGKHTATGEIFNPDGRTAAHRTLPFGSRVTVTNPRTGQHITVVINDRGPFVKGVTLDLARGAARAIGMHATQWVCMAQAGL